jgi:hypothetical protein
MTKLIYIHEVSMKILSMAAIIYFITRFILTII